MVSVTAHAPKLHTGPVCAPSLFLYWLERVPLDLERVRRWEAEGGAAFTEGRGGGERFSFDGPLHRSLSPGRAAVNSSCSHIPGAFYQPCFLLCIKPPFVVKQNVLKKTKKQNKRLHAFSKWEIWLIMRLTHQCIQANALISTRQWKMTDVTYGIMSDIIKVTVHTPCKALKTLKLFLKSIWCFPVVLLIPFDLCVALLSHAYLNDRK